ncbi:DUF58 domain-containing protein [Ilumatobacter coccineus]|uniref:DUF58 domain-containing protein n=1 Tax=Ilumatobacter coccineus (strain NBRC 103263 / KCTC 29153 / YM16-304) TaxID=1313172 RepID=A0A6C7EAA1_ILUCY|nr:DUF58 domain-containing protein [Ilumatobacter coccineus]BAN01548.1 hypothetical protein YM304_12340 [Ilumatobacter coccineus YM16-304]
MATRRSAPIPTGWLALVVLLVAVPLAVVRSDRWALVVVALALVAVAAMIDFFAALSPNEIEVEREFPSLLTVGEQARLAWIVKNRSERSTPVAVADAIWPSLAATRRSSTFDLPGRRQHRFGATIEPSRRGRFPFGAITIRTTGPLRMMHRQQTRHVPGTLAVLPAYPSRDLMATRMRIPLESGLRSVRQRGTGTDFDQLREYRPGDDIRRVDWAATARQQKAIVREYRAERNQHVVSLLDNGRVMAGTVGGVPRVEHAMDAVLGLTQVASKLGDNVGLVTFDQQVRGIVPVSNSKAQFSRIAEAMYLLDTSYGESAYRVAFTTAASRFRRRSLFVVYTDLVETVVVESLLPAMAALTKTHLVMIAAVRDPDVADWATGAGERPDDGPAEAYRSAAAVASLTARDRAVAKLSAAGAIVVDARPGELATAVVDQYLELKAKGRL